MSISIPRILAMGTLLLPIALGACVPVDRYYYSNHENDYDADKSNARFDKTPAPEPEYQYETRYTVYEEDTTYPTYPAPTPTE